MVLEFVGGADRAFHRASSTLTHVFKIAIAVTNHSSHSALQEARAVIRARARVCVLCVFVCTVNRVPTVGTAALVRQAQPTPVPRVIPVIIAPFGVGAGVQLLIWSFYNELSRWAACR